MFFLASTSKTAFFRTLLSPRGNQNSPSETNLASSVSPRFSSEEDVQEPGEASGPTAGGFFEEDVQKPSEAFGPTAGGQKPSEACGPTAGGFTGWGKLHFRMVLKGHGFSRAE